MRARNLQTLTDEIKARYPGVVVYGIGDKAHQLRSSDHNEDDTPGVRTPQSDPDSVPEHRAIDVMLGPAFSRSQAEALVREILAQQRLRDRLAYVIFYRRIWSRSTGWAERAKTDDPHLDHVHFSGWAANDEDASPWFGGVTMYVKLGEKSEMVRYLQHRLLTLDPKALPRFGADADFGGETQDAVSRLLTGGEPTEVNGLWFAKLDDMCAQAAARGVVSAPAPDVVRAAVDAALAEVLPALRVTRP